MMRFAFTLLLLAIGISAFVLGSSRPAAVERPPASPPPPPRRRIPPELTAAAAAERWYDEGVVASIPHKRSRLGWPWYADDA